jgi:hypothetical protein
LAARRGGGGLDLPDGFGEAQLCCDPCNKVTAEAVRCDGPPLPAEKLPHGFCLGCVPAFLRFTKDNAVRLSGRTVCARPLKGAGRCVGAPFCLDRLEVALRLGDADPDERAEAKRTINFLRFVPELVKEEAHADGLAEARAETGLAGQQQAVGAIGKLVAKLIKLRSAAVAPPRCRCR